MMLVTKKMNKYVDDALKVMFHNKIGNIEKNAFTRNRMLTFEDIIIMSIARKGVTTAMELFDFYKKVEKNAVSKQDYSKQRMKILESYWTKTLADIAREYYEFCRVEKLGKYIVIAIDGSKTILPRCKELEEKYGLANANNSQQKCVQCTISGCYDVLNNIMLNIQIAPYGADERELAKENIKAIKQSYPDMKFLIIFDRGYPSIDMLNFLDEMGIKYLIRLQNSTYEKEKRDMKSNDEIVRIKITKDRLTGKMSDETKIKLKEIKEYKTRFIKCKLSTGNTEWLATNLDTKKFPASQLQDLYFKRWKIETSYDTLKNKLQIENISGKCDRIVRQDIYSTIIVYNMIETISKMIEEEGKDKLNNENNKHEYKMNQNILIGAFKNLFIELVITESPKKKKQLFELFYQYALKYKTAIIPNRTYPREFKNGSTKCKINHKRAF